MRLEEKLLLKIQAGWSISTEMWDEVPAGTVDPGGDDSMPRYATPSHKPEPKRRPKAKAPVECTSITILYIVSNVIIPYYTAVSNYIYSFPICYLTDWANGFSRDIAECTGVAYGAAPGATCVCGTMGKQFN